MATATVRELRGEFPRLLRWLQAGETVVISRRGCVVARLVPPPPEPTPHFKAPDFAAQRRFVSTRRHKEPLPTSIFAEERGTYER